MKKGVLFTLVFGFMYFFYVPETAYCECKKCSARAIELRKKLLEDERREMEDYDTSAMDWDKDKSDDKKKEKKKKKKSKKQK